MFVLNNAFMVSFGSDCINTDNKIEISKNKIWPCVVRRSNSAKFDVDWCLFVLLLLAMGSVASTDLSSVFGFLDVVSLYAKVGHDKYMITKSIIIR